jgi:ADP-ribose pyrophosphatase
MSDIKEWQILSSREIFRTGFFSLKSDQCQLPDGRVMPNYYVFGFTNWVQTVPLTIDGQLILVRQYRHAIKKITLEFPGGGATSSNQIDVESCALRELREETGFHSDNIELIGRHYPNPASHDNELFTFLALDCEKKFEQKLDPFEDIEVVLMTPKKLFDLVQSGEINHSLVVASLFYALKHLKLT